MSGGVATVGRLAVSVTGDVDDLKAAMSDAKSVVGAAAKDMAVSVNQVSDSTDKVTAAGKRMVAALQEEVRTFGMSREEILIYKASLTGAGDEVERLVGQLQALKAAQSAAPQAMADANATQRIRDMVAASIEQQSAINNTAMSVQILTTAQAGAARVSASWADAQRLQAQNMAGVAASMKAASAGTQELSVQTQAIMNRYDPLGTKLRALQSDLAVLRKEMGNSVDPAAIAAFKGLEDEISKTQALMVKAGAEGFGPMEEGAKKSGLATASATRELMVLGHEAMSGNFSRMPGSFMVLIQRAGALPALLSAANLGLVAMASGAALLITNVVQAHTQLLAMNNAIASTNDFAGMTRGTIRELADEMARTSTISTGAATDIVTAMVASGKIGASSIASISANVANFAAVTGKSTEEATSDLIRMFSDPTKGAEELNGWMHNLTVTDMEHISTLQKLGDLSGAQLELSKKLTEQLPKERDAVTPLGAAYDALANSVKGAWQWLKDLNNGFTPEQHISQWQTAISMFQKLGEMTGDPSMFAGDIAHFQAEIAAQQTVIQGQKDLGAAAEANRKNQQAWDAVKTNSTVAQIQDLNKQLTLIQSFIPANDAQAKAQQDAVRKTQDQIVQAQRSIGAEGRQLMQQQLTDNEQFNLLVYQGQATRLQNQLKIGAITQEQFDEASTQNKLAENAEKQIYESSMANVAGLTAAERQSHLDKLKYLREEALQIKGNGTAAVSIDTKKVMDDYIAALDKSGEASIKSLDAQIAKEQERGKEIGLTKAQVEALHSAQQDAATADLQNQADAIALLLQQQDLNANARQIYTDLLAQLNAQIEARRTLSAVMADNATREADAKAAADASAASKRLAAQAMQDWKDAGSSIADSLSSAFGTGGKAIGEMFKAYADGMSRQLRAQKELADAKNLVDTDPSKLEAIHRAQAAGAEAQVKSYADMATAAQGFFDQGSRGYKAMQTAAQVMHAAEVALSLVKGVNAVLTQGEGDPYSAFARMAAMAAVVAGLGVALSGGGSAPSAASRQAAQGTGSIMGDSNAKSDSINKSIELTASNSSIQINYLAGMEASLKSIESNIGSFASLLVRTTDVANPDINLKSGVSGSNIGSVALAAGGFAAGAAITLIGDIMGPVGAVVGLLVSKIPAVQHLMTSIFGGKQSLSDSGITLDKASLGSILQSGVNAQSYADITTSGGWFHGDSHDTKNTPLGADADQQFALVIKSMATSITQASALLGVSGDDFTKQLDSFVVDIGKVSLKGLTGDEIQKQLEAVFSKLGDQMAQAAMPDLQQFQQVGEGYLQTLTRVATDYAKLDASLQSICVTFGSVGVQSIAARESLIALLGGIDNFQSKTADFAQNFLTKAQQMAPVQAFVAQQLGAMGLGWIKTREDFASEIASLSGHLDDSGAQKTYAALMNLESAFAAITPAIVDATKSAQDIATEHQTLQDKLDALTMSSIQLHDKERATIDASNLALYDRVSALQAEKDAAQSVLGDVDNAFTVLQNAMKPTTDALSARITAEKSLSDAIKSTLSGMKAASTDLTERMAAQAQIKAALAIAKAGGPLPTADALKDALSVVSQDASSKFATQADYLKDLYSTKNDLSQLGDLADSSLSVDQRQLDSLNAMLAADQQQIDLLKGIATSLTVSQAQAGFQGAVSTAQANPVVAVNSGISGLYQSLLGRAPDAAGLAYWQQVAAGGASMDSIRSSFMDSSEYKHLHGVPGFAGGGDHLGGLRIVGEHQPELEATGPSRIFTAQQIVSAVSGGGNSAVLANAVDRLNKTVERQNDIIDKQGKTIELVRRESKRQADFIERLTNGGQYMPTKAVA